MRQVLLSTLVVLLTFTSIQAQKIKGNGKIKTETRSVGDYDKVHVVGSFDVILERGKEGNITIQGESNIIPEIQVTVNDGVLKIFTKKGVNIYTKKDLIITVPFEELDAVSLNGSGDIIGSDVINSPKLSVDLNGSGDIVLEVKTNSLSSTVRGSGDVELSGETEQLSVKVTGSGDFEGRKLESNFTEAKVVGSGDALVVANESINAKVTGSGDIEYKGNPKNKNCSVIGSGDIDRM